MAAIKTSVVPFVLTATGTGTAQHLVAAGDAGYQFSTDAYPAFGGKDESPSPLFYALGSLTSCNQVTGTLVAKGLGISRPLREVLATIPEQHADVRRTGRPGPGTRR